MIPRSFLCHSCANSLESIYVITKERVVQMYITKHFISEVFDHAMEQFNAFVACTFDGEIVDYVVMKHHKNFIVVVTMFIVK